MPPSLERDGRIYRLAVPILKRTKESFGYFSL